MEFVVSDDHPGLKRAAAEVLPEAAWPALTLGCPASRVAGSGAAHGREKTLPVLKRWLIPDAKGRA